MFYLYNILSDFKIFTPLASLRVISRVNITPLMSVKFTLPSRVHF